MHIIIWILLILMFALLFVIHILGPLFVPNLGWKEKIKNKVPKDVEKKMIALGKKYPEREKLLEAVLKAQLNKFHGLLNSSFKEWNLLFEPSFEVLWDKEGFLHCHQHNFVLRNLLLATKKFAEKDIKITHSLCYLNIHQYTKINISDSEKKRWLKVDPYAISLGFNIGEKLPIFVYEVMRARGMEPKKNIILEIAHKKKMKL